VEHLLPLGGPRYWASPNIVTRIRIDYEQCRLANTGFLKTILAEYLPIIFSTARVATRIGVV
ncbi:MAG TPA: hypothetical protein VF502_05885, partial [Stellaceae bacterium]